MAVRSKFYLAKHTLTQCHADVGGSSVSNNTPHYLARIPLRWMIRETFKTNTGIMFDTYGLERIGLNPISLYKTVLPRPALRFEPYAIPREPSSPFSWWFKLFGKGKPPPQTDFSWTGADGTLHVDVHDEDGALRMGTEVEEDLKDALSPNHDQLRLQPAWWLVELMPMWFRIQLPDNKLRWKFR
jgi:Uncharacterized alpha/beta hydrolase domain (DUF2235)